jgi:hypothetical protein
MKELSVNLNEISVRQAVAYIIEDVLGKKVNTKDIKFDHKKHILIIEGKPVFYYDKCLHYTKKKDFMYCVYVYLNQVEDLIKYRLK